MKLTIPPEPEISETVADSRLKQDSADAISLLAKADHRLRAEDRRSAVAFYRAAANTQALEDKERQRVIALVQEIESEFGTYLVEAMIDRGHPLADWHPRFRQALALMFGQAQRSNPTESYPQMPISYYHPGMTYCDFADIDGQAWVDEIEGAWTDIREEAVSLLEQSGNFRPYVTREHKRPQGDVHGMLNNSDWSTLDLMENGQPAPSHMDLCPTTYKTLTGAAPLCYIPNRSPSMMLSLLKAGKRIPPHTGMLNTRFVCHLPLIVPGDGALRVGSAQRAWTEGKIFAFDDTVEHEAWNNADRDRLVLIFDIWRPDLEPIEKDQITAMFGAIDDY